MDTIESFAAAALTGILASESHTNGCGEVQIYYEPEEAAARAWAIADAMEAERLKRIQQWEDEHQ